MTPGNRMFGSGVATLAPNATLLSHASDSPTALRPARRPLSLMKTCQ